MFVGVVALCYQHHATYVLCGADVAKICIIYAVRKNLETFNYNSKL